MAVNRRGFFAVLGAAAAAPKALKLVPLKVELGPFFGIDRTFAPSGVAAWLPASVAGRLEAIAEMHADGLISTSTASALLEAA